MTVASFVLSAPICVTFVLHVFTERSDSDIKTAPVLRLKVIFVFVKLIFESHSHFDKKQTFWDGGRLDLSFII